MALVVMLIALLVTVCVSMYLFLVRRFSPAAGEMTPERFRAEVTLLMTILLGAALLIIVFVIGAYLFIRIGQFVSEKPRPEQPTKYVDAWSQYRLTEEEIQAATDEEPPAAPGADEDEPPPGGPDHSDSAS